MKEFALKHPFITAFVTVEVVYMMCQTAVFISNNFNSNYEESL